MGKNANKGKFTRSITFERWMADAIQEIADENGYTFTAVVQEFLRQVLEGKGYTMGIGKDNPDIQPQKKIVGGRTPL